MCILFIAINQHTDFPLVVCANRDEFHNRPTQSMHVWPTRHILAGKDLQANGTWLGINKHKRFSALTNYRIPTQDKTDKKTRGELVVNALTQPLSTFTKDLSANSQQYQAFNLIYGDGTALKCYDSVKQQTTTLCDGFHSICNGAMDDVWPKMAKGQQQLQHYIKATKNLKIDDLFELMMNKEQAPDESLPQTGVPIEWERRLSSIFITSPEYGTRSTCVILMNNDLEFSIYERTYDNQGKIESEQSFNSLTTFPDEESGLT